MKGLMANPFVAQESIAFQSLNFFKELTGIFAAMQTLDKNKLVDSDEAAQLLSIVKAHTNMRVAFHLGNIDPSVEIPMVNKNNPLINQFIRNYVNSADGMRMINEADGLVRGSVNIVTGKVSGVFSEVASTINLPIKMFTKKDYTPEEIAAVTLHELGHLFTYYEFMCRSVTTNQILAGLSKALDTTSVPQEREAILVSVKRALKLKDMDVKALSKTTNNKVVEVVVVSNVTKEVVSEIGSNVYDFNTWEYLADEYAVRHGASKHLATALEKIYRGMWNIAFRGMASYLAMEAVKFIVIFAGLPMLAIYLFAMDSTGDGTYDVPANRFKRIRNQVIENLKDKNLSKDDHERLTADIAAIDTILAEVNDRRQFVGVLYDFLSPSGRTARKQELLQRELEDLALSDLYVRSAELKRFL
jgi:hypothetical protein